ncbi:MAG: hypothetical protein AB7S99_17425 [Pseudodonghicola sp.]
MRWFFAAFLVFAGAAPALAEFTAGLAAPWDGKRIPAGMQCQQQGGKGLTPPIVLSDIPEGTEYVLVEFNDRDYRPLSTRGGHGTLIYPVKGRTATLPQVPGGTTQLPKGVQVFRGNRATGPFASPGYIGPCSGGRGNMYAATVKAMDGGGKALATTRVNLGRY